MAHGERSGFLHVDAASAAPYPADVLERLHADAAEVVARYPHSRSALLPLLHLVQSVDGYVTGRGVEFCAEVLDLTTAEVSGVATFYTQYKRHPNGEYTVGVCTNTLCAIMGGDQIFDTVSEHLGIGHDETTADGRITLERIECNAACDYAPVIMTNWEFFDNQTPESAIALVDDITAGRDVHPTRGANKVCTFKETSRVLAGFLDGRADEGVGAGPASLLGLRIAHERGWTAPGDQQDDKQDDKQGHEQPAAAPDAAHPAPAGSEQPSATSTAASAASDSGRAQQDAAPRTGDEHSSADTTNAAPAAASDEADEATVKRSDIAGGTAEAAAPAADDEAAHATVKRSSLTSGDTLPGLEDKDGAQ